MSKKDQLSISGVDKVVKDKFENEKLKRNLTAKELFIRMLDKYILDNVDFTSSELNLISEAINITGKTREQYMKFIIVNQSKKIANSKNKENGKTSLAHNNLDKFIDGLIKINNEASSLQDKRYINQTLILREVAKKGKGFNVVSLRRYLELPDTINKLDEHHKQHGLIENHNREIYKFNRKQGNHK